MSDLIVRVSPHVHSPITTRSIMLDVIIALCPAAIASVIIFGVDSAILIASCIIAAMLSEFVFNLITKKESTISDLSAVVTGMLLALNLPASQPVWQAVVGTVFAIVVVKCLFGGIGQNFANPAIAGRIMLLVAFTGTTSAICMPKITDVVSSATPLALIGQEGSKLPSLMDMLLGVRGGALGETCALALIVGGIYLLARGVITWHAPVTFIATVFLMTWACGLNVTEALYEVLSGGLLIGAIFMATDYTTTPTNPWGKVIFGVGAGIITTAIRLWGSYPEGVSFSILFMNLITPYIDKWTARKPIGGVNA